MPVMCPDLYNPCTPQSFFSPPPSILSAEEGPEGNVLVIGLRIKISSHVSHILFSIYFFLIFSWSAGGVVQCSSVCRVNWGLGVLIERCRVQCRIIVPSRALPSLETTATEFVGFHIVTFSHLPLLAPPPSYLGYNFES